jgi:hypothetical protein
LRADANGAGPAVNSVTRIADRRQAPIDPWEPTEGFRESVMTRMSVTGRRHAASGQEPAWMRLARSASLGMAAIIMYLILGRPGYFTLPIAMAAGFRDGVPPPRFRHDLSLFPAWRAAIPTRGWIGLA